MSLLASTVKENRGVFLVYHSLPNLSNKDKDLLGEGAESRITPFYGRTGTGNGLYDAQGK